MGDWLAWDIAFANSAITQAVVTELRKIRTSNDRPHEIGPTN